MQSVHEGRLHRAGTVEPGCGLQLAAVEEALHQDPVDLLADAPVLPVDHVVDVRAVRQGNVTQVAERVVVVRGGSVGTALRLQRAVWLVTVRARVVGE